MKNKKFIRLICALLTVLMLVGVVPAFTLTAYAADEVVTPNNAYTQGQYETAEDYYEAMTPYYSNGEYAVRCDEAVWRDLNG